MEIQCVTDGKDLVEEMSLVKIQWALNVTTCNSQ